MFRLVQAAIERHLPACFDVPLAALHIPSKASSATKAIFFNSGL
jgi:hypothetical protein